MPHVGTPFDNVLSSNRTHGRAFDESIAIGGVIINPAINYPNVVILAKAGHVVALSKPSGATVSAIQKDSGCRIKSGMTGFAYFVAGLIFSWQKLQES
jgi:hypothetical protein